MKELLIGMGLGFIVGAIVSKNNKAITDTINKGVKKEKEIIEDIKDEVQTQTKKMKNK